MNGLLVEYKEMSVPFRRAFKTALREANESHSVVIKAALDDVVGFGESCPSLKITGESVESVKDHFPLMVELIKPFEDLVGLVSMIDSVEGCMEGNTALKCGLTSALIDAYMRKHGIRMSAAPVKTDITISIGSKEEILNEIQMRLDEGFSAFKIKIGLELNRDIELVKSIRDSFGYGISLLLDANQGYTKKTARKAIDSLYRYEVDLIEQPLPAWDRKGLAEIGGGIPIMADESLFNAHDALELADRVDYFNIKLNKSGGIAEALRIASIAKAYGLKCMVGCMGGETSVGVTAGFFLASLINAPLVDLDSPLLMKENPVKGGIRYEKDRIFPPAGFGFGIEGVEG